MTKEHTKEHSDLLKPGVPLVFTDGTSIYRKFGEKYIKHKVGFFILAPSGAGKTHFIKNQKESHWIDGDDLWMATNAHPDEAWWTKGLDAIKEIDQRSDVITVEAKKLGFWIMGASNYWLRPDAIILPNWKTHKKYIAKRENTNYDGGATLDRLEQVKIHRQWMAKYKKQGVPIFKSVEEAVDYLIAEHNKL